MKARHYGRLSNPHKESKRARAQNKFVNYRQLKRPGCSIRTECYSFGLLFSFTNSHRMFEASFPSNVLNLLQEKN
jgi:hypothetical protein